MRTTLGTIVLLLFGCAGFARNAQAQNLVIKHVRIIVGNGTVIDQGSLIVRDGKIVSVSAGNANLRGAKTIDARGMSAVPGFIDAHRHIMPPRNDEQWLKTKAAANMQQFLDAGYTTLLSGAGPVPGILELKQMIDSGKIKGPRVIPSGAIPLKNITADQARAQVDKLASLHIHYIGEEALSDKPSPSELDLLRAMVDESKKYNDGCRGRRRSLAGPHASFRLGHRGASPESGCRSRAGFVHDWFWRSGVRSIRERQQAPLPRRRALAFGSHQ